VKTFGSQFYLALALLIVVPVLSRFFRRFVGRGDYRRHYLGMLASADYFRRSVRARVSEKLIGWVRTRRVSEARAKKMAEHPSLFFLHLPLSFLPAMLHRVLTDRKFGWDAVRYIVARPIQLYFSADAREQWIRGMVEDGKKSGMLTEEEAARIDSQLKEPFIQKYLKCLAVHVCMAPTTHVVALAVAAWYCMTHPGMSLGEATAATAFIFFIFQVIPMSPGSLLRGLYVLYIVLKEKNYREYKVALWLAFWKYVGYLAFPIQMAYRYPTLSRFMAGSWATGAVHIVPVFGEKGALLEHGIFDVFFNLPVTLRSRSRRKHGTAEEISADK
jgi:hypothetical protein